MAQLTPYGVTCTADIAVQGWLFYYIGATPERKKRIDCTSRTRPELLLPMGHAQTYTEISRAPSAKRSFRSSKAMVVGGGSVPIIISERTSIFKFVVLEINYTTLYCAIYCCTNECTTRT